MLGIKTANWFYGDATDPIASEQEQQIFKFLFIYLSSRSGQAEWKLKGQVENPLYKSFSPVSGEVSVLYEVSFHPHSAIANVAKIQTMDALNDTLEKVSRG